MSSDSLPVIQGEVRDITPVLTPDEAKAAMEAYQALANAVTDEADYQTFRDNDGRLHKFRRRSGWKKLERFFFVSVEVRREQPIHNHNQQTCMRLKVPEITECGCPIKGYRVLVRAVDTRSGRYSENAGVAVKGERRLPAGASDHDVWTRAFNRGANRATADLLGVSDPSAEEQESASGAFSKEERQALSEAFKVAPQRARGAAMTYLDEQGFDGPDEKAVYIDFLKRGTSEHYGRFIAILSGAQTNIEFDPDDIPDMGEEGKTA